VRNKKEQENGKLFKILNQKTKFKGTIVYKRSENKIF